MSRLKVAAYSIVVFAGLGAPLIFDREGTELVGYPDKLAGGKPTSCRGHTDTAIIGKRYTIQECDEQYLWDSAKTKALMQSTVKVPLHEGEIAAYQSWIHNFGAGNWKSSTLLKKLNAGDYEGACHELPRWRFVTVNGKKLDCALKENKCGGLPKSRAKELDRCLKGE